MKGRRIPAGFIGGGLALTGNVVAISRTGIVIRCSEDIPPGTIGRLGISLGQDVIRIGAEMQRRIPRVGLHFRFVRMSSHDRQLLGSLLFRMKGVCMLDDASDRWASEEEFFQHIEKELARLREWTSSTNWVNTSAWDEVLRSVHNLRGTAALVGHPIIARIFEGLEEKLEHAGEYTDVQLRGEVETALTKAREALRVPPPAAGTPATPPVAVPRPAALSPATLKRLKPLRILLLDDDPSFRARLRAAYEPLGMTIFEMARGSDLTPDFLQRQKIDVLVLDLKLPGEDGYSICKRLKASPSSCHVPIVFVSVVGELESRLFGWQVGGEDFIVKPVDPLELLVRVEFLVEGVALRRRQQLKVGVDYDAFLRETEKRIQEAVTGKENLVLATLSLRSAGVDEKKRAQGVKYLLDHLRRGDTSCSPAAGYLMVLQPDTSLPSARKAFAALSGRLKRDYALECRVGIAQSPKHGETPKDLLAASKECLDRALEGGTEAVVTPDSRKTEAPRPPKLVLVDDDEAFLEYLGRHFAELGFSAVLVSSSQRAVEYVRKEEPDLVTLDILMPDPDGLKVLEELKRDPQTSAIPVIIVSGKGEEEYLHRAFELGAADYIVKPFRPPELNARVRKVLREKAAAD
jgi:DNA-binding response OmpR family regulator